MRIHTLLAPIVFFALAGCSLCDSMSGHNPETPNDPTDEPDPPLIHIYDIPLSFELVGTGLDLDTGTTDHWYNGPGEYIRDIDLLGWDLAAYEQHDLFVNDHWGAVGKDLDGTFIASPEEMYLEAHQRGILVTTDQGAVFRLTDAQVYGPKDQQHFSVTSELVEPGICDPHCGAGRFDLNRGGRTFLDLQTAPDLASLIREEVSIPLAEPRVIVVETDEGRVYKLAPVLDEADTLIGIYYARL